MTAHRHAVSANQDGIGLRAGWAISPYTKII
jgi:hypothetical protein